MIDTHCHLYLEQFDTDRPAVIKKAMQAGVDTILTPAIDFATSQISCELSREYPDLVYAAVGIHPNYSSVYDGKAFDDIFARNKDQIVAVGEIGLDYYRDHSLKQDQIAVFEQMLSLAIEKQLPICLHTRESEKDLLDILSQWYPNSSAGSSPTGVFHAYEGSPGIAAWALAHGFLFGIGGMITYKRNSQLREIIVEIGLEHLIVETDSPYLTPVPYRGKRNTPEYIPIIIQEIATLFGKSMDEISQATDNNANRLFGFK